MFADDDSTFSGKHYQLDRPLNHPLPISRPHPPILVGGGGERKTLRLVAQYADACNLFESGIASVQHKLDVLQSHCADVGRPYPEIEKTTLGVLSLSADGAAESLSVEAAVDRFGQLAELGIDEAIVSLPDVPSTDWALVATLVEKLTPIAPAGR